MTSKQTHTDRQTDTHTHRQVHTLLAKRKWLTRAIKSEITSTMRNKLERTAWDTDNDERVNDETFTSKHPIGELKHTAVVRLKTRQVYLLDESWVVT